MAYRTNESDKAIDDLERANDDSSITVNVDGKQRSVGSPLGAADDRAVSKAGVVVAHDDKLYIINAKAGKRRTSDAN